eukprot:CAMPEP_0178556740 /NCGR_PEP_ID=MMETSP0697-20121206/9535_1 /TAXON_ID=265572 /ORGANISM="Extubocellulus spinifer, Strain CCMP396" /LENGTH=721 /DNA_ID=CAMNT_0020189791 /DNA_START=1503 /DNA_END=3665 /DNA_ORIENTATION=-
MGISLESLVVLDVDGALEGTGRRQRRRRPSSTGVEDENADNQGGNHHGDDQHDEEEEQNTPSPQRDVENMPPASTRPLHKWSFRVALFLAGVFVILMMGLAGRHGKYLRERDDDSTSASPAASAASTVSFTASARTDAGSISGAAPALEDDEETETEAGMRDPVKEDFGVIFAIGMVEGDDRETASPSVAPTPEPSKAPSSLAPTARPTTIAPSRNPTRSPSLAPTKVPTAQPHVVPTVPPPSEAEGGCKDDTTYLSPLGMDCSKHATLNCNLFDDIGVLTPEQTAELLQKCPVSCKVPPEECLDDEEVTGNDAEVQESCQTGWSQTCQDNMMFRSSPYGQPCEYFREIDCHGLFAIGYKVMQIADIMNQCPCACEVECGTVRIKDTGTGGVSSKSLNIVTPVPTDSPTPLPTGSPSFQPSTAGPSSSPTRAPTTAKPTTRPSSAPVSATSSPSSEVVPQSSFPEKQAVNIDVDMQQDNFTAEPRIYDNVHLQQEEEVPKQSVGLTAVQAGAVAGIMALSILLALSILYIAQQKRDRATDRGQAANLKADLEASYEDDAGEYEIEEQEVDEESVPDVVDSNINLEPDDTPRPAETEGEEGEEEEYEIVVLSEDGHQTAVVDFERGAGADSRNVTLKSCLRDSEQARQQKTQQQQQQRQQPQQQQQSMTWGNCRVRHVEKIPMSQSDSFHDVSPPPSQEDDNQEWPTEENVRFYQLGMLKSL